MKDRAAVLAASFLPQQLAFAGQTLRPLTAGSLLVLQQLGNSLFTEPAEEEEDEADPAEVDEMASLLGILEFVWVHTAPMAEVMRAVQGGPAGREAAREKVFAMALEHPMEAVVAFGDQFAELKERLGAAMTVEAGGEGSAEGKPPGTSPTGWPASSTPSAATGMPPASDGSSGSCPSSAPSSTSTPASVPPAGSAAGPQLPPADPNVILLPSLPVPGSVG